MRPTRDLLDLLLTLDSSVEIRISHGVWLEEGYPIRSEYRERVHTAFGARVENVNLGDPAAAAVVNQWVDDATHGRIREFVSPADLDLAATASGPFVRSDGSTVSVPMMRQTLDAQFAVSDSLAIVDLPYGARAFSMTLLVPGDDVALDALVRSMTPERWQELLAGLQRRRGDVWLPRFELTYSK